MNEGLDTEWLQTWEELVLSEFLHSHPNIVAEERKKEAETNDEQAETFKGPQTLKQLKVKII